MSTIAHETVPCAVDRANVEPIGERYFTSLVIDDHLPDSYYSLLFVAVYLSKRGRPIARGVTEFATRAGVARSTASLGLTGLTRRGYLHPALRSVGGRPVRKVRCPRGGRNVRLSAYQVTTLAQALETRKLTGFEIRLLLWLVDNIAEDCTGGIVGYRRNEIARRLGVSRGRVTAGVRSLARLELLRVKRGKRGRWTLTPLHAIPSNHPRPPVVLRAAHVARIEADDPRDPAAAINAAEWAATRRARRSQRATESNTQRATESNTPSPRDSVKRQVSTGESARSNATPSRGSSENAFTFVGTRRTWRDRVRAEHPGLIDRWASRRKRE